MGEQTSTAVEWSRYMFRNEEAREAYYAERDSIDRRYKRRDVDRARRRAKQLADEARTRS